MNLVARVENEVCDTILIEIHVRNSILPPENWYDNKVTFIVVFWFDEHLQLILLKVIC